LTSNDPPLAKLFLSFAGNPSASALVNWESYAFDSEFLTPSSAFTFTVGDEQITPDLRQLLQAGAKVQLFCDLQDGSPAHVLSTGFIDQISIDTSRGGSTIVLRGRDMLGPVCDAGLNPWSRDFQFADGQTLADIVGKVFFQFGIDTFFLTDAANRSLITGIDKSKAHLQEQEIQITRLVQILDTAQEQTSSQTISVWIDPSAPVDLTQLKTKQLKPEVGETCYEFAERMAKRFHLHVWAMADGSGVVISKPDYTSSPNYALVNRYDGQGNNVIRGTLEQDYLNQPNVIIAKGFQGGGDFAHTRIKAAKVNEFTGYTFPGQIVPAVQTLLNSVPGLTPEAPNDDLITNYAPFFVQQNFAKPVYIEDSNSKTLEQIRAAVVRKMSEFQRHALTLHYTVEDHHQNGTIWRVNEIARVEDQTLGITGNFWISRVGFKKSRSAGTLTDLTLMPLNTLQF
jgi:prophage tail gpP-like protein